MKTDGNKIGLNWPPPVTPKIRGRFELSLIDNTNIVELSLIGDTNIGRRETGASGRSCQASICSFKKHGLFPYGDLSFQITSIKVDGRSCKVLVSILFWDAG